MRPLRVATWLGIGDIHWIATKLRGLSDYHGGRPIHAYVNVSPDHASVGYLQLIPFVAEAHESAHALKDLRDLPGGYRHERWSTLEGSAGWRDFDYVLIANGHLETGKPIATYLPEIPTEYRYPLLISDADREYARRLAPPGSVLLYPSGVNANTGFHRDWWKPQHWAEVIRLLNAEGIRPYLVGSCSDSDMAYRRKVLQACFGLQFGDLIGKTSIPQVCALIEDAAVWCGLNSGIGIVSAMRCTPTVMMWADDRYPIRGSAAGYMHHAMQRSWLNDEQLEAYRTFSYGSPELTPASLVDAVLSVSRVPA